MANKIAHLDTARRKAVTDPLTGILNGRGLAAPADREAELAARTGRPLAVILFDIDSFQEITQRHGHAAGDLVLREVARTVREEIRETDLFGRLEGDRFMLVLPNTSRESAAELAESIRARVAARAVDPTIEVTACFGVAALATVGHQLDWIQSMAEGALDRVKKKGRNRVETSSVVAFRPRVAA